MFLNILLFSFRKMLLSSVGKEKESLGSDGETSDYQRSTPSPRDGNSRIPDLATEGQNQPFFADYTGRVALVRTGTSGGKLKPGPPPRCGIFSLPVPGTATTAYQTSPRKVKINLSLLTNLFFLLELN